MNRVHKPDFKSDISNRQSAIASPSQDDPRVIAALREYAAALEGGRNPDRGQFLAGHANIAEPLAECLDGLEFVHAAGPPLQASTADRVVAGSSTSAELEPATPLGDFQILREIGRGGMGVVYEALQLSLGRRVALKVLPFAATLDARQLQRFKNEAQAAAQLHHPHIVPVYYVGCERGVHFYAMQFIEGQTLAQVIADLRPRIAPTKAGGDGELPPTQDHQPSPSDPQSKACNLQSAIPLATTVPIAAFSTEDSTKRPEFFRTVARLGVQAAEALEFAHQSDIIHRDIKPANLLVEGEPGALATGVRLWITDFGLARLGTDAGLTMSGDLLGTLRYMSPEQALGKRTLVDHRTDVYSLGVTLYELLTLEPAYNGHNREEVLRQIAFEEPRLPHRLNAAIPVELETIVLKAMAKSPGDRYTSAHDLADDLRRFLEDRPIRARRVRLWERAWRWCRRNPVIAGLATLALGLLLLTAGALSVMALLRQERNAALRAQDDATAAQRLAEARATRWSGQIGQRFRSLSALAEAAKLRPSQELRNDAIACLTLADLRLAKSWEGFPRGTTQLAGDANFERYARSDLRGDLTVRRVTDDQELLSLPNPNPKRDRHAWVLRFSPDGRLLAAVHDPQSTLRIWDLARRAIIFERTQHAVFDFSPDSQWLAANDEKDKILRQYDLASNGQAKRFRWPADETGCFGFAYHPDGRKLAIACRQPRAVQICNPDSGIVLRTLHCPAAPTQLAWHPGGDFLAAAFHDHIAVWDARTGKEQSICRCLESGRIGLAFNHRGDLLASSSWDGVLSVWDALTGRPLIVDIEAGLTGVHFSSDDRFLGPTVKGAKVEIWGVQSGGAECRTLCGPLGRGEVWTAQFSPDGRILAAAGNDGIRLWDCTADAEIALLPTGPASFSALFHPGGGSLITSTERGLHRWPIKPDPAIPAGWQIGPPESLGVSNRTEHACLSADGQTLAVADRIHGQAFICDLQTKAKQVLGGHRTIDRIAISPDGRWVASASRFGEGEPGIKVWDAPGSNLVTELPAEHQGDAWVAFSGDGRWLATGTYYAFRLWWVGTWELGRVMERDPGNSPGNLAFTSDGSLLAVAQSTRLARLFDAATGYELATLPSPVPKNIYWLCFSPDGTKLAVCCEGGLIYVWDLRLIRQELAAIGLDWDLPPYPPANAEEAPARLKFRVIPGDFATPPSAKARELSNTAWRLATDPDPKTRDAAGAIELARQAVELAPAVGMNWRTLGVAHYRAGAMPAAITALQKSLELQGENWFDLLVLAMAHWQQGDKDAARKLYDRARRWLEQHVLPNADSRRFAVEAAALLGQPDDSRQRSPPKK
jgi:serine/threonine protein kinase/WD40 repeat protein